MDAENSSSEIKEVKVTVKTLDSQNHTFTVSDNISIKDFKNHIHPTLQIPVNQQRLIYRGRVLQDEKKISEYDIANNTIHLVQRPESSTDTRNPQRDPTPNINSINPLLNIDEIGLGINGGILMTGGNDGNALIMGTIGFPQNTPGGGGGEGSGRSSAAVRLHIGNQFLNKASNLLQRLEDSDEANAASSTETQESSPEAEESPINDDDQADVQNNQSSSSQANRSATLGDMDMEIDIEDPNSLGRVISQVANAASTAALMAAIRQAQAQGGGQGRGGSIPGLNIQANLANAIPSPPTTSTPSNTTSATPTNINLGESQNSSSNERPHTISSNASRNSPRLREMAVAIQDLIAFHERMLPYLQFVQRELRENNAYEESDHSRSVQYTFDVVSSIMHLLSHSYHAFSDLICDFSIHPDNRRLRASTSILVEQSTVVRATIPIPIMVQQQNISGRTTIGGNNQAPSQGQTPTTQPQQQQQQQQPPPSPQQIRQPPLNLPLNMPMPRGISINVGIGSSGGSGGNPFQASGFERGFEAFLAGIQQQQQGPQQNENRANAGIPQAINLGSLFSGGRGFGIGGGRTNNNDSNNNNNVNANNNENNNNNNNNTNATPTNNNRNQMGRAEIGRRGVDPLLSCHSHHNSSRQRLRRRPNNLRRYLDVNGPLVRNASADSQRDFFDCLIDLIRCSTFLNMLQPIFLDIIQNYLLRGRDTKNSAHIRTCSKSLAKKLLTFLQTVTKTLKHDKKVDYESTYLNLITKFYSDLITLTLDTTTTGNRNYRNNVLFAFEEFMYKLFAILRVCLPDNLHFAGIFAKAFIEEYFDGLPLVFRGYAINRLTAYFNSFTTNESSTSAEPPQIVYLSNLEEETKEESEIKISQVQENNESIFVKPQAPQKENTTTTVIEEINNSPQPSTSTSCNKPGGEGLLRGVSSNSMDVDIDTLEPVALHHTPMNSSNNQVDNLIRNLPEEWTEGVLYDVRQQFSMPDQMEFSPGYTMLFHRK